MTAKFVLYLLLHVVWTISAQHNPYSLQVISTQRLKDILNVSKIHFLFRRQLTLSIAEKHSWHLRTMRTHDPAVANHQGTLSVSII